MSEAIKMLTLLRENAKKTGSNRGLQDLAAQVGIQEIESLQREKAETDAELKRAYADLESIRRENEELRSLRDLKSADGAELNMRANLLGLIDPDLSNTHDSYTVFQLAWIEITNQRRRISELEAAAITPEMRERIKATVNLWDLCQGDMNADLARDFAPCAMDVLRDLLGEQDA